MSRFSRADAEANGWNIVHEDPGASVEINDPQHGDANLGARLPAYRAEKYVNGKLVNEYAESEGLLLERIYLYEQNQERIAGPKTVEAPIDPDVVPLDADGIAVRSVIGPGGVEMTEEEWSSRDRNEAIYDGEKMVYQGPHAVALEADEARQELAADVENEKNAEPDVGDTEQIEYDTADSIDSPGQSAGGVVVVRKGESLEDVSVRRDEEKANAESERVNEAIEASIERKKAEEAAPEVEDKPSEAEIQSKAIEEKAQELGASADEHVAEIREAGAEAVQEHADAKADDSSDEEAQPLATDAAAKLAEEQGVDLHDVDGSGKDGKITKPDVEKHLDSEDAGPAESVEIQPGESAEVKAADPED